VTGVGFQNKGLGEVCKGEYFGPDELLLEGRERLLLVVTP
jgi:hypothetical protein